MIGWALQSSNKHCLKCCFTSITQQLCQTSTQLRGQMAMSKQVCGSAYSTSSLTGKPESRVGDPGSQGVGGVAYLEKTETRKKHWTWQTFCGKSGSLATGDHDLTWKRRRKRFEKTMWPCMRERLAAMMTFISDWRLHYQSAFCYALLFCTSGSVSLRSCHHKITLSCP